MFVNQFILIIIGGNTVETWVLICDLPVE